MIESKKILGIILIPLVIILFWWNETRVTLFELAERSVSLASTQDNPNLISETPIHTTGQIFTDELLGDNLFLRPGKYIAINRKEEEYDTGDEDESAHWDKESEQVFTVSHAKVGIYDVPMKDLTIPFSKRLPLTSDNTILQDNFKIVQDYIFKGTTYRIKIFSDKSTLEHPANGDVRFSYQTLANNTRVTLFGKLASNHRIVPYIDEATHKTLYRLFIGTYEQARATLRNEYLMTLWLGRLGILIILILAICLILL